MNKAKIQTIAISITWCIMATLLIFLILKTNKLQYNLEVITWEDLIDITPIQKVFDLTLFQESFLKNIKDTEQSIVWIYEQKSIELLNENIDENGEIQTTNIETVKVLQWNWIIISNDGYIITNKHVVEDLKSKYTISLTKLEDNKINYLEFNADKIRYDDWLDLAIIKIKTTQPLVPAKIINISQDTDIWQIVFALKSDPEIWETITKIWIINSKNQKFKINKQDWEDNVYIWLLQNSTAIEPWFSGWPLIDINWKIIWINTAIDNIEYWASYALPLTQEFINQTISSIKESSKIIRPYLWIEYKQNINWIQITKIIKNSPADIAWVEMNDVIYSINDNPIKYNNFLYQLYTYKPKKNIILNIQREKFKQDIQINLWIK
jgi:S1-C subfamily serine protease